MQRHGAQHIASRQSAEGAGLEQRGMTVQVTGIVDYHCQPAVDQGNGGEGVGIAEVIAAGAGHHLQGLDQRLHARCSDGRSGQAHSQLRVEHRDVRLQPGSRQQRAQAAEALAANRRAVVHLDTRAGGSRYGDVRDPQEICRRAGLQADTPEQYLLDIGQAVGQAILDGLGGVLHAATAQGDDAVHSQLTGTGHRLVDAGGRGTALVAVDHPEQLRLAAAPVRREDSFQPFQQAGSTHAGPAHQ
ncbi:hypothetical protein D9M68_774440 [compost metagenome]